ncbi:hypothetical protein [Priestia aryabhattai]
MLKNLRKYVNIIFLSTVITLTLSPTIVNASTGHIVTSDGFFTGYEKGETKCEANGYKEDSFFKVNKTDDSSKKKDDSSKKEDDSSKKEVTNQEEPATESFISQGFSSLVSDALDGLVDLASGTICAVDEKAGIGLFSQIYIFSEPVNVTYISGLMAVTGIVQWVALTLMVFGILYYGYQITLGKIDIDPFKFSFRYLISMFLVYYAPYFVQDILNLNNKIVDTIANASIPITGNVSASAASIIPMAFFGFIASAKDFGGEGWLAMLVMLVVIILTFVPLLKLVVWWYLRLFKIYLYTVMSPLMFASLAIENTSDTGNGFLKNYVQEVFSQLFVVLAVYVVGAFIAQLPVLAQSTSMGVVGLGIALYAALSFLHEVPNFATGMISGKVDGGPTNTTFAQNFKNFRSTLNSRGGRMKQTVGRNIKTQGSNKDLAKGLARDVIRSRGAARIAGNEKRKGNQ